MHRISSVSRGISEKTRSALERGLAFCEEIVQWRRPVFSSYYLLGVNAAFWGSVFYLDGENQFLVLVAIAFTSLVSCVLSRVVIATGRIVPNTRESYRRWFGEENKDDSLLVAILKPIFAVAFLAESFLLPMVVFTSSLLVQRAATIVMMTGSAVAAGFLRAEEQEKACWTAYLTVLLTILIPPWRYNGITESILAFCSSICKTLWLWLDAVVVRPVLSAVSWTFYALRYCVCGYWIRPLMDLITNFWRRLWSSVRRSFIDPMMRLLAYLKRQFIYWACGMWIPPLLEYLGEKKRRLTGWIRRKIVDPLVAAYNRTRDFCVYWFGGYWIPPFCDYCLRKKEQLRLAFYGYVVDPIVAFFSDFKNNMKYILLGHWIPPFTEWLRRRVVDPVVQALAKAYYTAEYIVCGRWIPGFVAYSKAKALETRLYVENRLRQLRAYVIRRAVETKDYLRDSAIRTAIHVKTKWLVPFVQWLKMTRTRLRRWFISNVLVPAWEGTKNQLRRFKFYIKHHVLYPALRRTAYLVICGVIHAWKHAVTPLVLILTMYGVRGKEYAWMNWVEPGKDWLNRNLPEKSPFVDDSDTELKDFLPSEEEEDEESGESEEDEQLSPAPASGTRVTAVRSQVIRLSTKILGAANASSSDEDDEFSIGLKNFPTVENADSDEEEEKSMVPRKSSSASSSSKQRHRSRTQSSGPPRRAVHASPAKPVAVQAQTPTVRLQDQKSTNRLARELEPDFEMIDHNDVDD